MKKITVEMTLDERDWLVAILRGEIDPTSNGHRAEGEDFIQHHLYPVSEDTIPAMCKCKLTPRGTIIVDTCPFHGERTIA